MAEEHKHGSMDTTEQEKTFNGFIAITKWSTIIIIALLLFIYMVNG
ncbi:MULTISPECIES: aa3-type cytochrome c oxidase subunit IV [unclassified Dinoroseobacter]